jgi:hypothetical protein
LDPIQPLDFRLEHTFNNEIGGYLPDKDKDVITCGKSESSTVLNRVLPSYSIYMRHYVVSQAEVKVEGEPIPPGQSVHDLVDGMDTHVESCEADQEGQRESDIEPESITKLPRCFSDLFFVFIFLMKDVQEDKTVEGRSKDRMSAWVTILCRASEDLNLLAVHIGPWLTISHLCQIHNEHREGNEQEIVKGSGS